MVRYVPLCNLDKMMSNNFIHFYILLIFQYYYCLFIHGLSRLASVNKNIFPVFLEDSGKTMPIEETTGVVYKRRRKSLILKINSNTLIFIG